MSLLATLANTPPSAATNCNVAPLVKSLPKMVRVWSLFDAGIEAGDTLLIDGAEATTVKLAVPDSCPSGLMTLTVQVPASLPLLSW